MLYGFIGDVYSQNSDVSLKGHKNNEKEEEQIKLLLYPPKSILKSCKVATVASYGCMDQK